MSADYQLWLDDYRPIAPAFAKPGTLTVHVADYTSFVSVVETRGCPKSISFDHDLADAHYGGDFTGPEKTGYDCAKWFGNWLLAKPERLHPDFQFAVHSMNPVGAENIRVYLRNVFRELHRAGSEFYVGPEPT